MVFVHLSGQMLRGNARRQYSLETPISNVIADFIAVEKERAGYRVMFNNKYYSAEGSLQRIEGIKDHHSVRVVRNQRPLQSAARSYPAANREKHRLCQKTIKYMDDFLGALTAVNDYVPSLIQKFPVLKNEADTLAALCDRQLTMHSFGNDTTLRVLHPVFVDIVYNFALFFRKLRAQHPDMLIGLEGKEHLEEYVKNGFPEVKPERGNIANATFQSQQQQHGGQNITLEMLQSAIFQSMNPSGAPGPSPGAAVDPAASAAAQEPQISREQQFAAQLQQLHEFGFTDDGENVQALVVTEGNVEQALEVIISMREGAD